MFLVGLLLALLGGLLGIGLSREAVKKKYPVIGDYYLDVLAFGVLVVGLIVSAVDHYQGEAERQKAEKQIRTLGLQAIIDVSANWKEGSPPNPSQKLMLGGTRTCSADFVLRGNKTEHVEFHRADRINLAVTDSGMTRIQYYTNAIAGTDIYSSVARDIETVKNFSFTCIFSPDDLANRTITIHRVRSTFFVNGRASFYIEMAPETTDTYPDAQGQTPTWTILDCGKIIWID